MLDLQRSPWNLNLQKPNLKNFRRGLNMVGSRFELALKWNRFWRFSDAVLIFFRWFLCCFICTMNEKVTFAEKLQMKVNGTSINVGPKNVGGYKPKTYKRRTSTNVVIVQTSDWFKCWTVQTSDRYNRQTSTNVAIRENKWLNFMV